MNRLSLLVLCSAIVVGACTGDEDAPAIDDPRAADAALQQLAVGPARESLRVVYQTCPGEKIDKVAVIEALFGSTIRWDLSPRRRKDGARTYVATRPRGLEDDGPPPERAELSVKVTTTRHEVALSDITIKELLELPQNSVFVANTEIEEVDDFARGATAAC